VIDRQELIALLDRFGVTTHNWSDPEPTVFSFRETLADAIEALQQEDE
jgi:hypothetical protein